MPDQLPLLPAPLTIPHAAKRVRMRRLPGDVDCPPEFDFRFPASVRRAFARPKRMLASDWGEKDGNYRVIGGSRPGEWRRDYMAYSATIRDAYSLPWVRMVSVCGPPQTGKTDSMLGAIAWAIDQDPGPAMIVFDTQDSAKEMSQTRLLPLLRESPCLSRYLSGSADDEATKLIQLLHMPIYIGWATSVSRLANRPIKHLILDEVDKYKYDGDREAGPVSLALKRVRMFLHTFKVMRLSSPTTPLGEISQALAEARIVFLYFVRCPTCGCYQLMRFTHDDGTPGVIWPGDVRDWRRVQDEKLARYRCMHCEAKWDDHARDMAVRMGEWRDPATGTEAMQWMLANHVPHVAFQYSALLSPAVPLSETAAAFMRADAARKVGDLEPLKDFLNGYLAEVWEDGTQEGDAAAILRLRDDRPAGLVPGGGETCVLLAAVDTQDDGFWYEIRAFGYGQPGTSWGVRSGFIPSASPGDFAGLDEVIFGTIYTDPQGLVYPVQAGIIDAMGHRTHEVYDWCRRNPIFLPAKGEQRMGTPHAVRVVDTYPGSQRAIPGGLRRVHVNATHFKNLLHGILGVAPADPGAWLYHAEVTEEWAKQMVAEYRDAKGLWQCPKGRPNHAWDVSYNLLALADMLQVRFIPRPEPAGHVAYEQAAQGAANRPGWWGRLTR